MNHLSPNSIKGLVPYVNPNPKNIQIFITATQQKLAEISYLTSFGETHILVKKQNDDNIDYPGAFSAEGKDYISLIGLDNFNAYSFLLTKDPLEVIGDYNIGASNNWTERVDLIVWYDLNGIDANRKDNFYQEVFEDIKGKIGEVKFTQSTNEARISGFEIIKVYNDPKEIFREFTVDIYERQLFTYPYGGFRFELKIYYTDGCI